jgi:membrane-associated phospholipid phosphatase
VSPVRIVIAVLLFILIAVFGSFVGAQHWDRTVTTWLQQSAPAPDLFASVYVFLGDAEVVITGAVLAGLVLLSRDRPRGITALRLAAGMMAVSLLALLLKHVIPHPGPPTALVRRVLRFGISGPPGGYSLPSGHTMRTTFIAGTVLRRYPLLAGALVLCMMAALVYLGDHWTTDVLAGLCLGWACVEVWRGFLAG